MAKVRLQMQALANPICREICTGCDKEFDRGEMMSAVEYDDGEPAGWFCDACIRNWNETIAKGKSTKELK